MKVVFLERMVPDYRTRFFEMLHERLISENIDFHLVSGQMRPSEDLNERLPSGVWVHKIRNVYFYKAMHWARMQYHLVDADMVIFHPHSSALSNFRLIAQRYLTGKPKIGFFGHGGNNMVEGKHGSLLLRERFKAAVARLPDWWFPYTAVSVRFLQQRGVAFPQNRMTVVNNAIDTSTTLARLQAMPTDARANTRSQLGIGPDEPVGLYCGRMRPIKLGILIESAFEIKRKVPNFHLVLIGKGAEADRIHHIASENKWVHFLGSQRDDAALKYFIAADVFLMPSRVGLAILDAFAAGLPLFTTDCRVHSPEIEYFESERNGVMTTEDVQSYANAVVRALGDPVKLHKMSVYARETASKVNMETMADNFVRGIRSCLGQSLN